jgi:hypothetical protein
MGVMIMKSRVEFQCQYCGEKKLLTERRAAGRKFCDRQCYGDHLASRINSNFFSQFNPEMAYVLGLIVSDGCLCTSGGSSRLSIKSVDLSLLEMVKEMMLSEYGIYPCGFSDRVRPTWKLEISNRQIISDLRDLGICERKTSAVLFPDIPSEIGPDFIRGVFDGDGYVGWRWDKTNGNCVVDANILGTEQLLAPMPQVLGVKPIIVPCPGVYSLRVRNHEGLASMYRVMYHSSDVPCLQRKKNKFDQVIDIIIRASEKPHYGRAKAVSVRSILGELSETARKFDG